MNSRRRDPAAGDAGRLTETTTQIRKGGIHVCRVYLKPGINSLLLCEFQIPLHQTGCSATSPGEENR